MSELLDYQGLQTYHGLISQEATPSTNGNGGSKGLMSASDKEKLDSISTDQNQEGYIKITPYFYGVDLSTLQNPYYMVNGTTKDHCIFNVSDNKIYRCVYQESSGTLTSWEYVDVTSSLNPKMFEVWVDYDHVSSEDYNYYYDNNYCIFILDEQSSKYIKYIYNNYYGYYVKYIWDDTEQGYIQDTSVQPYNDYQDIPNYQYSPFYLYCSSDPYRLTKSDYYPQVKPLNGSKRNVTLRVFNNSDTYVDDLNQPMPVTQLPVSDFIAMPMSWSTIKTPIEKHTFGGGSFIVDWNGNDCPKIMHYTLTGNVSGLSSLGLKEGQNGTIIFVSSSNSRTRSVEIAHRPNASSVKYFCPDGQDMSLTVPEAGNGYLEVNFLCIDNNIYVRAA